MCNNQNEIDTFINESMRILHNAYVDNKLVLFLGAGVDKASSIPLWNEVISRFCECMNIHNGDKNYDNLRIPQYYYNSRGKKEYVDLCREIFGYNKQLPINKIHRKIVDFNVHTIITTNYSDFIEREMKNKGLMHRTICQDKDLSYIKGENLIIKMHGDFEHDNFVLKEDDYLKYSNNFRLIETYIKSIIATNTVLFIGYSFNDPDLKQLFSWVKDILGEDFQQAYMLEVYKDYDKNEFDYYKNLGVNVLYIKEPDKDINDSLLTTLDMVISGKEKEMTGLELANEYFKPYLNMNYILERYLNVGLHFCDLRMSYGNVENISYGDDKKTEDDKVLDYILPKLDVEELSSEEPYFALMTALKKSGAEKMEVIIGNQKIIKKDYTNIPHKYDNKILEYIINFDYRALKNIVERDDFFDNSDDEDVFLKNAYIFYVLGQYAQAYKALYKAAEKAYQKNQYYLYYLAQFNKFRIGKIVKFEYNQSEEVINKIQEDLDKINLETIISNTPVISNNDNQILRDINSFQVHYSIFQEAYRVSENVKEQQETVYSFFGGIPDYMKLEWLVKDYYCFIVYNGLMVDNYVESKEVFKLYVNCIIMSVCTPDKEGHQLAENVKGRGNVHLDKVGKFELFLLIKYMQEKEINSLLDTCDVKELPVEDECKEYIKKVILNLNNEDSSRDKEFWNTIIVMCYLDFDSELAEISLDAVANRFNSYSFRLHSGTIYKFLHCMYTHKRFKNKEEGVFQAEKYSLGRFLNKMFSLVEYENETYMVGKYKDIISNVIYYFNSTYGEDYSGKVDKLLCTNRCLIAARIFPYCAEKNKALIKQYFGKWSGTGDWNSVEIYYDLVYNKIIEPSEQFEKMIYRDISKIKEKSRHSFPNDYQNILITMYNLYLNDLIVCVDELKKAIEDSDNDELKFLNNIEEYNFNNFKLEWLKLYKGDLLQKIASKEIAKSNIKKIFAERVQNNNIDKQLLKIYFKYFA